jgi:hypothetical protein
LGGYAALYYAAIKAEGCTPGSNRVLLRQKIGIGAIATQAIKERRS